MRRLPRPASRLIRRRWVLAAAPVAALSLVAAGCGGTTSQSSPSGASASTIAGFIPASAPIYVELSTDVDGAQWTQVDTLAKLFPAYPELRKELEDNLTSGSLNYETQVKPLLGGRAGLAVLSLANASTLTTSTDPAAAAAAASDQPVVAVADLADGKDAEAAALLDQQDPAAPTQVGGVAVNKSKDGVAAVVDGAIVFAPNAEELKLAIDAHSAGGSATLAGSDRFTSTISKLPGDTFAQAYIDYGAVIQQQVAAEPSLAQAGALTAQYKDARVAVTLAAESEGMRMKGVSLGIPPVPDTEFSPKLTEKVPSDAIAYVGFRNLQGQIANALKQFGAAGAGAGDPTAQLQALTAQLQPQLGVSVADLSALTTLEHGLVVTSGAPLPGVALALEVEDGARASKTLDTLRERVPTLIKQFSPETKLPEWRATPLEGGVQGWDLPVAPTGGVTYGVEGKLAIIGSSPATVRQIQRPASPLSQSAEFTAATAGMPDKVDTLAWINVQKAVALGEASGAFDGASAKDLANLRPIKSVVAWSTGGETPTFEMFVKITK
jgi:Protein of unknown function (DUF3352)